MAMDDAARSGLTAEQVRDVIAQLASPDVVDSPFGQLEFFDGVPTPGTVSTIYDALDLMRGIDVFLNCVPGASLVALRNGFRSAGVTSPRVIGYTDPRANSRAFLLTANTETTYGTTMLDLKEWGPTVVEAPPASLCVVDDFWFRYVADMGIAGPDKGQGGKYLYLPPGYDGEVPEGYFTYRSPTYTNWVVLRALGGVPAMKQTRIYPLAEADAPRENEWIDFTVSAFNTIHSNDFSFYEEINELVQEEPAEALDAERAGQLAAIGILKGQPFAPDDRLRAILEKAARIAAGISRARSTSPATPKRPSTARGRTCSSAAVTSSCATAPGCSMPAPSSTTRRPSSPRPWRTPSRAPDSAYAGTVHDANGDVFDGGKTYRLHVDPDVPAKNFWAVDVYDTQTRRSSRYRPRSTPPWPTTPARWKPARRLLRPVLRPHGPRRQRIELGRDDPRQILAPVLPPLRPAPALVRPDLET